MPRIQHNMKEEAERIDKFKGDLSERTRIGMLRALQTVRKISAANYLRGPRPENLGIASEKLIRAMQGGHHFGGGIKETGSASESSKGGWISAWKVGNMIHGEVGVDVTSSEGFDYPEYWEERGTKHGGPRPFMVPAGQQALSAGLLDRDIQIEIDKAKLD